MRLDPSGVLTVTLDRGAGNVAQEVRNVLLPLEAGG
jgi:hypothetical protein